MPSEDKPPQQTRQRKKNKNSRSKGKSPGGSPSAQLGDSFDQHDDLILPPVHLPPKKPVEEKPKVSVAKVEEESSIAICLQVLFPYLLAGMGMVMAGMVLDSVQIKPTRPSCLVRINHHNRPVREKRTKSPALRGRAPVGVPVPSWETLLTSMMTLSYPRSIFLLRSQWRRSQKSQWPRWRRSHP
ncbi:uncharacterized protein LOC113145273 isoform X3 [Mastacembelus armatus]|uniref:uncharacterized protein LOC113145273 isoform X3 n=1 Tax=Mastacembelus armatus TaxID=205130 RepID=UPI000E454EDF|nr:uncharacterized protein LOC113145273 isoform X3 [Mastacembelus armatus]XP_026187572.1 uncharacterized protein LOC113145273 isoform X3 [Mastacembelus armatus]XP_026187573.1 uncharacterized protein LOC113145273 isoform X3 [Mastacembelus armatus]XP_026187574.1 uncharacterized protein LOC113145273 isoform X3 [Mastacembelus armatus]